MAVSSLVEALLALDRSARLEAEGAIRLRFPAHHPQGLVRALDRWWLSTVDIGAAEGHLLGFDGGGALTDDIALVDGPRFHPGGIDVLDDVVVVPVAEYRPDSTTALVRVELAAGTTDVVARVDDHIGALAHPAADGTTTAMTWGSRRVLTLDAAGAIVERRTNPSHWMDVQDVQRLDAHRLLCSGIGLMADGSRLVALGGLGVWDERTGSWVHELPLATTVASGRILTSNPVWTTDDGGDVVLHAAPDDDDCTLVTHRLRRSR